MVFDCSFKTCKKEEHHSHLLLKKEIAFVLICETKTKQKEIFSISYSKYINPRHFGLERENSKANDKIVEVHNRMHVLDQAMCKRGLCKHL